jgi:hypothetical protein
MRDKILQMVQVKGPLLPVDIRGAMSVDSMIVGAYLSELIKAGKVKKSHAKVGNSPLYYVEGQEKDLEQLKEYLNPKQQQLYDVLKQRKVLKDEGLTEVMKDAIRNMQDFAIPLKVNKTKLFWKFYLVPQDDAISVIRVMMEPPKPVAPVPQAVSNPVMRLPPKPAPPVVPEKEIRKGVETIERRAKELKERESIVIQKIPQKIEEELVETGPDTVKREITEPKQEIAAPQQKIVPQRIDVKEDVEKEDVKVTPKPKKPRKQKIKEEIEKEDDEEASDFRKIQDPLMDQVKEFFKEKNIIIKDAELVRKEREIELIITVPSVIGRISYFCAVRNKKKCNEGDVSSAVIKAQSKNLPTLFLTTGEVTKKALEMVGKEFKQLLIKTLRD